MNTHIMIKRSAQSVLHHTSLPRDEADRIGERAANEYVKLVLASA